MNESYQDEPSSAALATTSSYKIDSNWYSDIDTTDHIPSDLDCLAVRERYHGGEQVQVGNEAGLQILHTGHYSINTATRPLTLPNILLVPEIFKHLLSIYKFSCNKDIFFEFHLGIFLLWIDDRGKVFWTGGEFGLYPIKPYDVDDLKLDLVSRSTSHSQ